MHIGRIQPGWSTILQSAFHLSFKSALPTLERRSSLTTHLSEPRTSENGVEHSPDNASVLENITEDYVSVLRGTSARTSSTLSLIQAKLPEKLPSPIPNDATVFEDDLSSEYTSLSTVRNYNPRSVLKIFGALLETKRFDEAYDLMQEIRSADIDIPPSHIFEFPAREALLNPSPEHSSSELRTARFLSWLQLIPTSREANFARRFQAIRWLVFRTEHTNLPLAIQFSIVMASKGYIYTIGKDAIPFVMLYAPPAISVQFIKDLEQASLNYHSESRYASTKSLKEYSRRMRAGVRSLAVRALARANHMKEAISLLPGSDELTFQLPPDTYQYLLTHLYNSQNPGVTEVEAHIAKLLEDPIRSPPSTDKWAQVHGRLFLGDNAKKVLDARTIKRLQENSLMEEVRPESDRFIGESLAAELKALTMAVQSPTSLPSIDRLASFIRDYMKTGRTNAIIRLRRLALNAHTFCGAWFLQAEMTHYLLQDSPISVLRAFNNHFFLSGVPQDEMLDRLHRSAQDEANRERPHKYPEYAATRTKYMHRLMPHHSHIGLVWQALIKLTYDDDGIDRLYRRFLHLASLTADKTSTDISFLRSSWSHDAIVGPAIFTSFIQRLLLKKDPGRFSNIVQDMMKLNIIPTVHHFTQIGRFYANRGDIERTFQVMDTLESQHPVALPIPMTDERLPGWNQGKEIPRPDIIFYTALLRGFIRSKQRDAALEVVGRFKQRYIYVRGSDSSLDEALDDLQNLLSHSST